MQHNKRLFCLLGLLLLSVGAFVVVYAEPIAVRVGNSPNGLAKYNVVIESVADYGVMGRRYGVGSGVVISGGGIILTAKHVVDGATSVRVTLHDGRMFTVTEFYTDPNSDVAYIDLPCDVNDYISLSDCNDVEDNDKVIIIGNPGGILEDEVAYGRIINAALNRLSFDPTNPVFMVCTKIVRGYSGGGVYFGHRLVGIVSKGSEKYAVVVTSKTCMRVLKESGYATGS